MDNALPAMSRRERLRAQTLQEIEEASFAIIDAEGVDSLSIAAIARSMAMSAPAVYRYFPSRDALVAHLVTLSYQQLTTAIGQAVESGGPDPRARLGVLVTSYRDWALRHRRRYGMLFGERATDLPASVTTRTPLDEAMALLIDMLMTAQDDMPDGTGDEVLDDQLRGWAGTQRRPGTPPSAALAAVVIWTRVHGIVSLELTGIFDDHTIEARRLIDLEIDRAVRSLGAAGP